MSKESYQYKLQKKLVTMTHIGTAYGDIKVSGDMELESAVYKAVNKVLTKRLNEDFKAHGQIDWLKQELPVHHSKEDQRMTNSK